MTRAVLIPPGWTGNAEGDLVVALDDAYSTWKGDPDVLCYTGECDRFWGPRHYIDTVRLMVRGVEVWAPSSFEADRWRERYPEARVRHWQPWTEERLPWRATATTAAISELLRRYAPSDIVVLGWDLADVGAEEASAMERILASGLAKVVRFEGLATTTGGQP